MTAIRARNYTVRTFSEAKTLLKEKNDQLKLVYNNVRSSFEETQTLGQMKYLQCYLSVHEHDVVDLRDSLDVIRFADKSCTRKEWQRARAECTKHISELRYYYARVDAQRRERIQEIEKKIVNFAALFSYAFLFPNAAGNVVKLIPGINDWIPPITALSVAALGLGFHFSKGKKVGEEIITEHNRLDLSLAEKAQNAEPIARPIFTTVEKYREFLHA